MRKFKFSNAYKAAVAITLATVVFFVNGITALAATNVTIKEASVRVRQSASTDSTQLGSVKQGTSYDVIETVSDSSGTAWYKIKYDGTNVGFIRADMAVDSTSAEATTLKNGAATATATPTPTPTPAATATPTPAPTQAAPTVDTSISVAVSTQVEDVNPVSATVSANTVNVRGEASADSGKVTTVNKNTAVTVVGQANGNDGKVWYLTNFTYEGNDVKGFIRSDFLSVSGEITAAAAEPVEEEVPEEPEEPAEPETPPVPQDYELRYEADETGADTWYLYDNTNPEGTRKSKLSTIIEAAETYLANKDAGTFSGKAKIIIIVMAIFIVLMALAITLLIFKIRDLEYDDDEDYDSYGRDRDREPRAVRPGAGRPVAGRPEGRPVGQRPAGRPEGRPVAGRPEGRPAPRPEGRPVAGRPEGRPAARPEGARPEGRPVARPEGARPEGRPAGRPEGRPAPRPEGARPEGRPAPRPQRPDDAYMEAENPKAPRENSDWKPKNIAADNDDFEFEFLNKWDEDDK